MNCVLTDSARIVNYTVNGKPYHLTVVEDNEVDVTLTCKATGRPSPTVTLTRDRSETSLVRNSTGVASHVIRSARCEDSGRYTCEVNNGIRNAGKAALTLSVLCKFSHTRLAAPKPCVNT
jgi:hypothetical protein